MKDGVVRRNCDLVKTDKKLERENCEDRDVMEEFFHARTFHKKRPIGALALPDRSYHTPILLGEIFVPLYISSK